MHPSCSVKIEIKAIPTEEQKVLTPDIIIQDANLVDPCKIVTNSCYRVILRDRNSQGTRNRPLAVLTIIADQRGKPFFLIVQVYHKTWLRRRPQSRCWNPKVAVSRALNERRSQSRGLVPMSLSLTIYVKASLRISQNCQTAK
jgi:hypothetical protein